MTTNIIVLYALIFTGLNFIMIIVGRATYKDTNADLNSKGDKTFIGADLISALN
jgi:hypothetical protein